MTGRALVFSQSEIIQRLQGDFVPFAGDKWYLNRQQDADGAFVRKLGEQAPGRTSLPDGHAPQGIYVAAPDGTLLAYDHFHPDPKRFLALLRRGEEKGRQTQNAQRTLTADTATDTQFARKLPAGGLVLKVFSRIPLPPPPGRDWTPNLATGRDHLWLTGDEWRALLPAEWKAGVRYPLPRAVAERLLRFHLVDNVRGEPPFWGREDIRERDLTLRVEDAKAGRLVLEGTARMQQGDERGYHARVQGHLTYDKSRDRLTRFDLLSWGEAWGEGPYTRGAPEGRFPLVIAATLAGSGGADAVPPQASRDLQSYFGTGRASR